MGVTLGKETSGEEGASFSLGNPGAGRRSFGRDAGGKSRFFPELYCSNTRKRYCGSKSATTDAPLLHWVTPVPERSLSARGLAVTIAMMLLPPAPVKGSLWPTIVAVVLYTRVVTQRQEIGRPEFHQNWLLPIESVGFALLGRPVNALVGHQCSSSSVFSKRAPPGAHLHLSSYSCSISWAKVSCRCPISCGSFPVAGRLA